MWAPHTYMSTVSTAAERVTDTGCYFGVLIQTAGVVSHIQWPFTNPSLLHKVFTYWTLNSKDFVSLSVREERPAQFTQSQRRSKGHQDKEVADRGAPKSTGDSIYTTNTTGKYCWQLLEAPVTSADPERGCDDDAFFPALSNAFSTLSLVLAGWASSGNWPDWEIILQNWKDG